MSTIKHDMFPAYVAIISAAHNTKLEDMTSSPLFPKDALQVEKARVIVFDDYIIIAVDGDNGHRVILEGAVIPETFVKTKTNCYITTKTGAKITYMKDTNCGCGSRLKSWNPYTTLRA
jgi:hypothetical protein